jgi:hypothetical protein
MRVPHWKSKWGKSAISNYNKICKEFNLKPVITSVRKTFDAKGLPLI